MLPSPADLGHVAGWLALDGWLWLVGWLAGWWLPSCLAGGWPAAGGWLETRICVCIKRTGNTSLSEASYTVVRQATVHTLHRLGQSPVDVPCGVLHMLRAMALRQNPLAGSAGQQLKRQREAVG